MTSHRQTRSTLDGLPIVSIAAALMAAAPSGGRSPAADSGDARSQTDRENANDEPGRDPPNRQAARPVVASSRRFGRC